MRNQSAATGRALVVDDSRLVRAVVSRYLNNAGYETQEAIDGADALKRLASEPFDVVISDLHMPHLDGMELLAAVKRLSPDVEVIILTGTRAQDMRRGCAQRGLPAAHRPRRWRGPRPGSPAHRRHARGREPGRPRRGVDKSGGF